MKIVITDYSFPNVEVEEAILKAQGHELVAWKEKRSAAELTQLVADADAVITQFAPVTAEVISSMQRAKVIVRYGIGVDNVDLEAAKAKGIPVCNVPDYCIDEVARPHAGVHSCDHAASGSQLHAGSGREVGSGDGSRGDEGAARPDRRRGGIRADRAGSRRAAASPSNAGFWFTIPSSIPRRSRRREVPRPRSTNSFLRLTSSRCIARQSLRHVA